MGVDGPAMDLSVSRPYTRIQWGIRVPDDSTQVMYVWFEALVNYLTAADYPVDGENDAEFKRTWPPKYQVLGKDILRFHGLYWPAFLMALKLDLPHQLVAHGHWMHEGGKMSKSGGNVISPEALLAKYSVDSVRYFLLHASGTSFNAPFIHFIR